VLSASRQSFQGVASAKEQDSLHNLFLHGKEYCHPQHRPRIPAIENQISDSRGRVNQPSGGIRLSSKVGDRYTIEQLEMEIHEDDKDTKLLLLVQQRYESFDNCLVRKKVYRGNQLDYQSI